MENIKILFMAVAVMIILSVSLIVMRAGNRAKALSFWKNLILDTLHSYMALPVIIFGMTVSLELPESSNIACAVSFSILLVFWFMFNKINIDGLIFYISGIIAIIYFWVFIFGIILNNNFTGVPGAAATVMLCVAACIFSTFFVSEASESLKKYMEKQAKFSFKKITAETVLKAITAALPTITGIVNLLKALKIIK